MKWCQCWFVIAAVRDICLKNAYFKCPKQFFVYISFSWCASVVESWWWICRVRSISADEQMNNFSVTWRHLTDYWQIEWSRQKFPWVRCTIDPSEWEAVQNHGGREPECGSERWPAHNPASDLIFCMKTSLHNTSVPMAGSSGRALTGRRPPLQSPSVPRETIFPSEATSLHCLFPTLTCYNNRTALNFK